MSWPDLHRLLARYRASDPAARSTAEILLLYPGVKATLIHHFAHILWTKGWYFLARLLSEFARFLTGIEIHPGAVIGPGLVIDHGIGVVIGETAIIGVDCTIYQGVTLGGVANIRDKRHPTLGDRVTVGTGAKILGNISIGDDARIGANSVVLTAVPAGKTAVGIPARIKQED